MTDKNMTRVVVLFGGRAAFPTVDIEIQIGELYKPVESGELLMYSPYQNTEARIKMGTKLGR